MDNADHDRLIRLEAELAALDRMVTVNKQSLIDLVDRAEGDIRQLLDQAAVNAEKTYTRFQAENQTHREGLINSFSARLAKLEQQIQQTFNQISAIKFEVVPRSEIKTLLDAITARQENINHGVQELAQTILTLRSNLTGQKEGKTEYIQSARFSRSQVVAWVAVVAALLTAIATLYLGLKDNSNNNAPANHTTTTTIISGK